jgi:ketosteroid isomerase-like protein
MSAHPNVTLIRELFTALAVRDAAVIQVLLAPTAVFHVPGQYHTAGDYQGYQEISRLWDRFTYLSAGSFELELEEVLAGDQYIALIGNCTAERSGVNTGAQIVWLLRVEGGRVIEGWLHSLSSSVRDAFWF